MTTRINHIARTAVGKTLNVVLAPVNSFRFRHAVATASEPVKINVGSSYVKIPGWINTDIYWRAGFYLNLTKAWPVSPGSVDRIYGDNVIEHFSLQAARHVLRHCYDALRPGGAIRFATPDLERTARAYLEDPQLTDEHLALHRENGYPAEYPADMLRVTFAYWGHHLGYIFDWSSLSSELAAAGFIDIRRYEAGESDDSEFVGLETRIKPSNLATELVIEARKKL